MVKLSNKRKLKWCLLHYETGDITSKWAANHLEITQKRFQQIYKQYQTTKETPNIGKNTGRPKKEISNEWKAIIKQQYEKTWCGAVYLEKKINIQHHLHIPKHIIHQVLLELGYAKHEIAKQKRRKPWIRLRTNPFPIFSTY